MRPDYKSSDVICTTYITYTLEKILNMTIYFIILLLLSLVIICLENNAGFLQHYTEYRNVFCVSLEILKV